MEVSPPRNSSPPASSPARNNSNPPARPSSSVSSKSEPKTAPAPSRSHSTSRSQVLVPKQQTPPPTKSSSPSPSPPSSSSTTAAPALPPTPSPPSAASLDLHVKLSLPKARFDRTSAGLRLKLTACLAPHVTAPVSFYRRGTIFDDLCPLVGRGGFWGVADSSRRPVRLAGSTAADEKKACLRSHGVEEGEGFLEFGEKYESELPALRGRWLMRDSFMTLLPGQEVVCEKLLPAKDLTALVAGEAYTVYSRPDREKKKPAKARCKWGTREELAESTFWMQDEAGVTGKGEDGDEEWTRVDVSHIVRDRDWVEIRVLVGNSVRFHVV